MKCRECATENRPEALFCTECGAKLVQVCPGCSSRLPISAKFCESCGEGLDEQGGSIETALDRRHNRQSAAERRQLTVMFCDLVDSTLLAERLDPEELREVLADYQEACGAAIERYEGYIARYVGDGLLVYFGYPQAHEDDAQRAVRAALSVIEAMKELNAAVELPHVTLEVRIGINTGLGVVGDVGSGERHQGMAVVGAPPYIAARLQAVATPSSVVIGASTHRLVGGFFDCENLGAQQLKGITHPVSAYRVSGETDDRGRFEATTAQRLTAMVGREAELWLLLTRWQQVIEGDCQVVLLSGEEGVGKSRIVKSMQVRLQGERYNRVLYFCSAFHQKSALYPVINQLERAFRFEKDDSPTEKLDKLEAVLADLGLRVPTVVPVLASLLSIPTEPRYPLMALDPEQLKRKTDDALIRLLKALAAREPVLMIVEDSHWADPSTVELLGLLIERLRASRILFVLVFRPEFTPPGRGHSYATALRLNCLTRKESETLVARVAGGKKLPDEVLAHIVDKTDGVPLFIEELTKTVLEADLLQDVGERYELLGPLSAFAIPLSLRDSLIARLDRLGAFKEVAQLAATFGRSFNYRLLLAVSTLQEDELRRALSELMNAQLIYGRGLPPDATYEFKHALVQDAAYQSLLKGTRQQHHRRIARVLEKSFPETRENVPEILAYHYLEADLLEEAIACSLLAGQKAIDRSGNLEAIDHLRKALELLERLPSTPVHMAQELKIQITLAVPLAATSGYAAPEVERTYSRARALCQQLGDTRELFPAVYGIWRYHLLCAEYTSGRVLGEELLDLAENKKEPAYRIAAHRALGSTLFYLGEFADSRAHLDSALVERDRSDKLIKEAYDVIDPAVASSAYLAWELWLLGYPDQSVKASMDAIAMAQKVAHPFSVTLAHSFAAWLHQFHRDPKRTQECAEAALKLATEKEFRFWVGWNKILCGWALAQRGESPGAIGRMSEGLALWRDTGSELGRTYFLVLLAEVYGKQKQVARALDALDEAQSFADTTSERWWQAEIHRMRGALLLESDRSRAAEAESWFRKALDSARGQQAKSLELRSAMDLSRLWRAQDKAGLARELLADVYESFEEGFDTPDLKDAQALLRALR